MFTLFTFDIVDLSKTAGDHAGWTAMFISAKSGPIHHFQIVNSCRMLLFGQGFGISENFQKIIACNSHTYGSMQAGSPPTNNPTWLTFAKCFCGSCLLRFSYPSHFVSALLVYFTLTCCPMGILYSVYIFTILELSQKRQFNHRCQCQYIFP